MHGFIIMEEGPSDQRDSEVQDASASSTEEREMHDDQGPEEEAGARSQEQKQEVLSLRARSAELEERLAAARARAALARERREFMEDEAEQAREYGKKLAQEMSRLARIAKTLPPDDRSSLEKLKRLVATLAGVTLQESTMLENGRAQEAALRLEIDDFVGPRQETSTSGPEVTSSSSVRTAAEGGLEKTDNTTKDGVAMRAGRRDGGTVLEKSVDDPLAVAPASERKGDERGNTLGRGGEGGGVRRKVVAGAAAGGGGGGRGEGTTMKSKKPSLEGRALLAEGLHRIEAAYEEAAAERDATASRLSWLRLAVARRQREEDATPGHAELLQYLLRFEELGRHALEREKLLRRCQAERSTLALTKGFVSNEARLLETIAGGVEEASKSGKVAREAYMQKLEGIVQEVEDSLANQTRLLDDASNRRRAAEAARKAFDEDRKRYLAGWTELAGECYRYEALNAHLALMRR